LVMFFLRHWICQLFCIASYSFFLKNVKRGKSPPRSGRRAASQHRLAMADSFLKVE
jgi:hypothetical protein